MKPVPSSTTDIARFAAFSPVCSLGVSDPTATPSLHPWPPLAVHPIQQHWKNPRWLNLTCSLLPCLITGSAP